MGIRGRAASGRSCLVQRGPRRPDCEGATESRDEYEEDGRCAVTQRDRKCCGPGSDVTPAWKVQTGGKKLSNRQEAGMSFPTGSSWLIGSGIPHRKCARLPSYLLGRCSLGPDGDSGATSCPRLMGPPPDPPRPREAAITGAPRLPSAPRAHLSQAQNAGDQWRGRL